jgi:RHS repeat-associated protein
VVIREYVWGPSMGGGIGGLLAMREGGSDYYYYLYDGKGNVVALTDSSGTVVATYTYDPFGVLMEKTGSIDQPFRFSTKRYDEETGLSYYGYRFYSPSLGRWMTRDPLGEAGGINLYGFVGNNAINGIDPLGLMPGAAAVQSAIMGASGPAAATGRGSSQFTYEDWQDWMEDYRKGFIYVTLSIGNPKFAIEVFRDMPAPECDDNDRNGCTLLYENDLSTCRKLSNAGARSRCYASAMERKIACETNKSLPPLVTW